MMEEAKKLASHQQQSEGRRGEIEERLDEMNAAAEAARNAVKELEEKKKRMDDKIAQRSSKEGRGGENTRAERGGRGQEARGEGEGGGKTGRRRSHAAMLTPEERRGTPRA